MQGFQYFRRNRQTEKCFYFFKVSIFYVTLSIKLVSDFPYVFVCTCYKLIEISLYFSSEKYRLKHFKAAFHGCATDFGQSNIILWPRVLLALDGADFDIFGKDHFCYYIQQNKYCYSALQRRLTWKLLNYLYETDFTHATK